MVEFTKKTPRSDVTIQGRQLTVPAPFAEGHTLTVPQAAALNNLLAENMRNNMSKAVKEANEKQAPDEEVQEAVDKYTAEYEFGARRGGGRTADPVTAKARELAKEKIKAGLKAKGVKLSDVGTEKLNEMVDQALEKYPQIREQASQIVEMQKAAIGDIELDVDD